MNKICVVCNKRPARIKFVKVVDGKWQDCVVCQNCLMRFAGKHQKGLLKLDHILQGLMDNQDSDSEAAAPVSQMKTSEPPPGASSLTCNHCGLSYISYRNTLILGCSECYESFREVLAEDLRRFHGATQHTGKKPENMPVIELAPRLEPADTEEEAPGVLLGEEGALVIDVADEVAMEATTGEIAEAIEVSATPPPDLAALRRLLKEAIASENFEEAARLRDSIKEREAADLAAENESESDETGGA